MSLGDSMWGLLLSGLIPLLVGIICWDTHRQLKNVRVRNYGGHSVCRRTLGISRIYFLNFFKLLTARGWERLPSKRDDVAIWRKGETEILVPLDPELGDFDEALTRAIERVLQIV